MFADDLLLFYKADVKSVSLFWKTFQDFSAASRLQANALKSCIYITGVSEKVEKDITSLLGTTIGDFPFRYFGVPLHSKKLSAINVGVLFPRLLLCCILGLLSFLPMLIGFN